MAEIFVCPKCDFTRDRGGFVTRHGLLACPRCLLEAVVSLPHYLGETGRRECEHCGEPLSKEEKAEPSVDFGLVCCECEHAAYRKRGLPLPTALLGLE
jgi:hypothetical protein